MIWYVFSILVPSSELKHWLIGNHFLTESGLCVEEFSSRLHGLSLRVWFMNISNTTCVRVRKSLARRSAGRLPASPPVERGLDCLRHRGSLGQRCIFKKSRKAHLQNIIGSNSWEDIANVYWVIKMSFQEKHTNWNTYLFESSQRLPESSQSLSGKYRVSQDEDVEPNVVVRKTWLLSVWERLCLCVHLPSLPLHCSCLADQVLCAF